MTALIPPKPQTYYRATIDDALVQRAPLREANTATVVVVGAGFAGLNTALRLLESGVPDVVLLEAGEIGQGASGRNGGFVFGGYSLSEESLYRRLGRADAVRLYGLTLDAVQRIRERAQTAAVSCDVEDHGVVWANWFRDPAAITHRQQVLGNVYGVEWESLDSTQLRSYVVSDHYSGGTLERDAFHFHPLRYAAELARRIEGLGGRICTASAVIGLARTSDGWSVRTAHGEVRCAQVALCGGGYLHGVHARVEGAMMPIATYVMVTEPLGSALDAVLPGKAAVYDSRFAFDYYRKLHDGRLLWGGRISVHDPSPERMRKHLRADLRRVFPSLAEARIDHVWSGLMSYARHQMPQLAEPEPGLWTAQAFGGHGVATTTVGGEVLGTAIAARLQGQPMPAEFETFQQFGLVGAGHKLGLATAQLGYWAAQTADALKVAFQRSR